MKKSIKRVAITGGAGQIAYSLLFRIAHGDLLGVDQPVALHILEIPAALDSLKGVVMELQDCCFPLLKEIVIGDDPHKVFAGVDVALLVGAKPRGPGMERKDLLLENAKIFVNQAKALNSEASKDARVLVVGNPCNTNCLIALHHAPHLKRENFFAMMRLDQNRAKGFLSEKTGVPVTEIKRMVIWGNHSATQVPDTLNVRINGQKAHNLIKDQSWLDGDFISLVQKRGAEVITARGKSSAASAANGIIDTFASFREPHDDWFSLAIYSHKNPYGIRDDLIFSFPCHIGKAGKIEIIQDVEINLDLEKRIRLSEKELIEERDLVKGLL